MDFNFAENAKVIPVAVPALYSTTAITTEWINMKNAKKATFFIYTGTIATGSTAVTLGVAASKSGTKSTVTVASMDLGLDYYYFNGAAAGASADVYTKTTVTTSTFDLASTYDSRILIIEVDANKMGQFTDASGSTQSADYVRLVHTTGGADYMGVMCILTGLRYQDDAPPTALA